MTDAEKKRSPRVRNLIAFSITIMLTFSVIVALQASQAHKAAIDNAKSNGYRLMSIMAQQIELTFLGVDSTLHRAVERQYYNDLFGGNLPDYLLQNMQLWVDESPRIAAMIMIDENGAPVVAAHKKEYDHWLDYGHHSFAKDELFVHLREGSDTDCYIGTWPKNGDKNNNLVVMGRKITHVDGSFGGVFIAVIDPQFFIDYFRSVDQGSRSYISLQLLDSGTLLVDSPVEGADYTDLNKHVLDHMRHGTTSSVDVYKHKDSIDIYASEVLKSVPLVINVVLDDEDYLKAWRQACLKDIGFLAIFTVFGSLLSFFVLIMARQIVRVEESESAAVLASQAKSEFLANMSHELRTPLNAIIGFSEMMNSGYFGPLNPKQKERVHDINFCGSHLLHLITDILEFSKGDAGKLELIEEKVVMQEIVGETMRMMNERIKAKRMNMLVEVDDTVPPLLGDKRKIRQILLNLLSNSLKFTPEDGTIKIAVRQDMAKNITMTVSDTGIGIAEEDIAVALSVFGQVHRSQSHEGTGLGLPLCKMFAELHGGKLALGSTPGEGTTVRIIFPSSRNMPPEGTPEGKQKAA
jgi:signal transduction histidine kinase